MIPNGCDPGQLAGQNSSAETRPSAGTLQPKTAASEGESAGLSGQRTGHRVICGLDCSLISTGIVCVATNWEGDFARVASRSVGWSLPSGASDRQRMTRLVEI